MNSNSVCQPRKGNCPTLQLLHNARHTPPAAMQQSQGWCPLHCLHTRCGNSCCCKPSQQQRYSSNEFTACRSRCFTAHSEQLAEKRLPPVQPCPGILLLSVARVSCKHHSPTMCLSLCTACTQTMISRAPHDYKQTIGLHKPHNS